MYIVIIIEHKRFDVLLENIKILTVEYEYPNGTDM